jgi:hypothetical protein
MKKDIRVMWQTVYLDKQHGYQCTLALEGTDVNEVLSEGKRILAQMQRQGVVPVRSRPVPPKPYREVLQ